MPIKTIIHRDQHYVHTICSEQITVNELLEYQQDIWKNGTVHGFNELFDISDADLSALKLDDILSLSQNASKIDNRSSKARMAIVVQPGMQTQLADFYRSTQEMNLTSSRDTRLFYDMASALSWLSGQNRDVALQTLLAEAELNH